MLLTVLVSISCALSVCAGAFAILALRKADPEEAARSANRVSRMFGELQNRVQEIEDVHLNRLAAQAESVLEKADARFEAAENKRKSVAAQQRHVGNRLAGANGGLDPGDQSLPRDARKAAIEAIFRGETGP